MCVCVCVCVCVSAYITASVHLLELVQVCFQCSQILLFHVAKEVLDGHGGHLDGRGGVHGDGSTPVHLSGRPAPSKMQQWQQGRGEFGDFSMLVNLIM